MKIFGKDKKSEEKSSPSLEEFLAVLESDTSDTLTKVKQSLRDLEISDVAELASKTFQFYQRYLGEKEAEIIRVNLKKNYQVELKDLRVVSRAPGDPVPIDPYYRSPNF